ncbi:hypothetical protein Tco_0517831 [Tanacetum coccineum]
MALPEAPPATAICLAVASSVYICLSHVNVACRRLVFLVAPRRVYPETPAVLAIRQGQIQKPKPQAQGKGNKRGKGKSKSNLAYDPKHKIPSPAKKEHRAKDAKFHHCHKIRH